MRESNKIIDADDIVIDFENAFKIIKNELLNCINNPNVSNYEFDKKDMLSPMCKSHDPSRDREFIVFDRDYNGNNPNNRTDKEYESYLAKCE